MTCALWHAEMRPCAWCRIIMLDLVVEGLKPCVRSQGLDGIEMDEPSAMMVPIVLSFGVRTRVPFLTLASPEDGDTSSC